MFVCEYVFLSFSSPLFVVFFTLVLTSTVVAVSLCSKRIGSSVSRWYAPLRVDADGEPFDKRRRIATTATGSDISDQSDQTRHYKAEKWISELNDGCYGCWNCSRSSCPRFCSSYSCSYCSCCRVDKATGCNPTDYKRQFSFRSWFMVSRDPFDVAVDY